MPLKSDSLQVLWQARGQIKFVAWNISYNFFFKFWLYNVQLLWSTTELSALLTKEFTLKNKYQCKDYFHRWDMQVLINLCNTGCIVPAAEKNPDLFSIMPVPRPL